MPANGPLFCCCCDVIYPPRSPDPHKPGVAVAVPMLWGGGTADATDALRLAQFKKLRTVPGYVLGYEEPDCAPGSGSAGMSIDVGVQRWEALIAPLKRRGTLVGSPSMCSEHHTHAPQRRIPSNKRMTRRIS